MYTLTHVRIVRYMRYAKDFDNCKTSILGIWGLLFAVKTKYETAKYSFEFCYIIIDIVGISIVKFWTGEYVSKEWKQYLKGPINIRKNMIPIGSILFPLKVVPIKTDIKIKNIK